MFQQVLDGQKQFASKINAKVDEMYKNLNRKFENLSTHMRVLETQVAENAAMVKTPRGRLPGNSETNPKDYI